MGARLARTYVRVGLRSLLRRPGRYTSSQRLAPSSRSASGVAEVRTATRIDRTRRPRDVMCRIIEARFQNEMRDRLAENTRKNWVAITGALFAGCLYLLGYKLAGAAVIILFGAA